MQFNVNMLCANEFALAIALTVFILLTVILSVLLISLAASKNFRAVFFHEKAHKKKSAKKQQAVSEPAPTMPQGGVDTIPIDPPKTRRTPTRKNADVDNTPEFLNAIPTIPLGGFPQGPTPTRGGKARSTGTARMTEIPSDDQGGTYTARSITITRARPSTPVKVDSKSAKDKTDKAETGTARTPKKR
ncbi:MAG: hypothetical protein K2O39_00060 [Clostridiales bacterium]|nr:hypothetical protein [Clostridiales bacterium]